MSSRCCILNLPIEILDLVYSYIPDMRDKINLAKANCVLGNAFALHVGDIFKKIEIEERPIKDWSVILSLCGSSVTRIMTREVNTTVVVVKLASMYCPNLEEFFFPVRSSFWKHIKPLLLPLQNLVWIGLMNSYENVNVVETLLQLPKLKSLQLVGFNRQDWEKVGKLVNLTELTIMNKQEEPIDVFKMCSSMKYIDSLKINFALIRIPKSHAGKQLWPKIELLSLCNGDFQTSLPYLPTLKYLTIGCTRMGLTDVFGKSVFSYGKTLESLRFSPKVPRIIGADELGVIMKLKALKTLEVQVGSDDVMHYITLLENLEKLIVQNSYISNRGAMMPIYRCKKLRYLDVFGCPMVDSDMVIEAVPALWLRPKSDKPFVLCVSPHFGLVDESELHGVLDIQYSWF